MKWIYYILPFVYLLPPFHSYISTGKAQICDFRELKHFLSKESDFLPLKKSSILSSSSVLLPCEQKNTYQGPCNIEKINWRTLTAYLEEGRAAQYELFSHLLQKIKTLATDVFSLKEEIHLLNVHTDQLLRNRQLKCQLIEQENINTSSNTSSNTPYLHHHSSLSSPQISKENTSKFILLSPYNKQEEKNLDKIYSAENRDTFLYFTNKLELFSL